MIFKDDMGTVYDIEMQKINEHNIVLRSRYYQDMVDLDILERNARYSELKKTYIIFISLFDPFGKKRCKYTVKNICEEDPTVDCDDGTRRIFLYPFGNTDEISDRLKALLVYMTAGDISDDFTKRLDESVRLTKQNKELKVRYMTLNEKLQDEREAGRKEGRKNEQQKIAKSLLKLVNIGKLTEDEAANSLEVTVDEFRKLTAVD